MKMSATATRPSTTTRAKIIKAASRAFAQHGYEGASIRTIVGQADVNQAAINYHFGSKEELYRAVNQTTEGGCSKSASGSTNKPIFAGSPVSNG
jgi:AcrR family transcriptional regulator